jgi:hypothetical protein
MSINKLKTTPIVLSKNTFLQNHSLQYLYNAFTILSFLRPKVKKKRFGTRYCVPKRFLFLSVFLAAAEAWIRFILRLKHSNAENLFRYTTYRANRSAYLRLARVSPHLHTRQKQPLPLSSRRGVLRPYSKTYIAKMRIHLCLPRRPVL